jgi:hypothetical protein
MSTTAPKIHGIRHHGPGCARSLLAALEASPPAALLVEGPPDADGLVASITTGGMKPPVAILVHQAGKPREAVFYPFAEFSPEWQALRWAVARGIPARFMDFPWTHRFGLRDAELAQKTESPGPVETETAGAAETVAETETETETGTTGAADETTPGQIREDPLAWLARADGYSDSERWWNDRVEERGGDAGLFAAVLEAMTALRSELALPETLEERRREASMRRIIRETQREVLGEIAVVCGAWHAPALANPPPVGADNGLLKNLPKSKTAATWVPWTFGRLCSRNGYGAGIESPGWYEHLWLHRRDPMLTARWLTRVGRLLRGRDLDASTAQVIDGVRLAEHLAAFRGRPIPGLPEMNEAALAVFCNGDGAPLRLVSRELIVGERLGEVPAGLARVPLQQDIEAAQKRLRMKPSASQTQLVLDLREPTGLERSRLLHRMNLLGIAWGGIGASGGKGTFRETWNLEWKPEFSVAIIDAARFGNTVEMAATGAVTDAARGAALDVLCGLLENALLADLPAANAFLPDRIRDESARGDDVLRLMLAAPALARLARYGNVRQTDASRVLPLVDGFVARIHAALAGAVSGIDDDAAAAWADAWRGYHAALRLLENAGLGEWLALVARLVDGGTTHPLLGGLGARLLVEGGRIDGEGAARVLARALSRGQEPSRAAAWLEGFLAGNGAVLVHDPFLLPLIEAWVAGLGGEAFTAALPLMRRTFSSFEAPERARIAGRLGKGAAAMTGTAGNPGDASATAADGGNVIALDAERVRAVLPVVLRLLGKSDIAAPQEAAAPQERSAI